MPLNVFHHDTLTTPHELISEFPASLQTKQFITDSHRTIEQILKGADPRILLIVGPCSIHEIQAAKEYAAKLHTLSKEVSETFFVIMRVYFEKPRTSMGWKGFLHDPHLDNSHDIQSGMRLTRELLLDLANAKIPVAAEFLDPASALYFGDLISWGCIGARTVTSQIHRQLASGLSLPIGFKNTTEGNIEVAAQAIITASHPHTFIGMSPKGQLTISKSKGNPLGHLVLRGGEKAPNYDQQSVNLALQHLERAGLPQHLVIDCSHDNSQKQHKNQPIVFESIIDQIRNGNSAIRGIMMESFLFAGNQPIHPGSDKLSYGVSITDSCMDWNTTEELILAAHQKLSRVVV